MPKNYVYILSEQRLHTIIAALNFYLRSGQAFAEIVDPEIRALASNGGEINPLHYDGVEELIEDINIGGTKLPDDPKVESSEFPRSKWRLAVQTEETGLGYWEWVATHVYHPYKRRT